MREPHNLIAFLDQVKHNDIVQNSYKELLRQRDIMAERINFSIKYGLEILQEVKCGLNYFQLENHITSTKLTNSYFQRISLKRKSSTESIHEEPLCSKFSSLVDGIPTYGHLESLINKNRILIEPEIEFLNFTGGGNFASKDYVKSLVGGLEDNPRSWKYYTLSSFYWRMKGNALEALDCVLRALTYAPRKFKDIPLLSLGSILYRSHQWQDAEVILQAAIDHAPHIPENHFALGLVFGMNFQLNNSLEHFDKAESLDSSFSDRTTHLKNFVVCATNLNSKIDEMHAYIDNIKKEVINLKEMKSQIMVSHEKLIAQQIPLGSRDYDNELSTDELHHRGQYCSTRTLAGSEPVLICDFYSDLQMKLESAEIDIDTLERDLKSKSEAIVKQMSKDYYNQFTSKKSSNK